MEKELLIKYVEMINRFEKLSKEERSIYSNTEEEKVIAEVRNLIKTNPELSELLKKEAESTEKLLKIMKELNYEIQL